MFKNLQVFKITQSAATLIEGAADAVFDLFEPCGPTQDKSIGWVPPRGEDHGQLLETVGGHHILKLMTETKAVPSDVLQRKVDEEVQKVEQTTGRKPGKKERREIKEDARMALLPMAFAKRHATLIWVNPKDGFIAIDAASQPKADAAITLLIKTFEGLSMQMFNTIQSPVSCMAHWLTDPDTLQTPFSIDRQCELKASDESKARVKYANHSLDIEEIREHIAHGKMPTSLSMTYDDRVSFTLTDAMTLKRVEILDAAMMGDKGMTLENDAFDADVAIFTGEISKLVPDLLEALGGEVA